MPITLIMSRIRIHITVKIRIQIRIEGKRWIRIRFEVKPTVSSRRFIGSAEQKALVTLYRYIISPHAPVLRSLLNAFY